jgi:hypothetical protein
MTTTAEDVAARILALADESPNGTITGGRLSELLKHHFPGFTLAAYGAKNLRAFIRDHLSGKLDEIGVVGTDIVYGLPGASPPSQAKPISPAPTTHSPGTITQDVIRVFKSPNAPFELHANRETGEIRVVAKNTALSEPWGRIKPASPDTLQQIVRDFVSNLPEAHRASLIPILDEYPWWPKFSIYLQEKNLYGQWAAFKGMQLRAKLEAELRGLGVLHADVPDTTLAEEKKLHIPTTPRPGVVSGLVPSLHEELRDVIVRVVQSLPISELRGLRLPVGDVYDALKQHR